MLWQRQLLSSAKSTLITTRHIKAIVSRQRQSTLFRYFSALQNYKNIQIWYASQGGTAQLYAHQLAEGMEDELEGCEVTIHGLHEQSPESFFGSQDQLHFFLVSCAGVGEVPDNGRDFWDWIMQQEKDSTENWKSLNYSVFGLGNQQAHPNHYNVIGKKLDAQLEALGANRWQALGLGDDGDCLDDDFDQWMEDTLERIKQNDTTTTTSSVDIEARDHSSPAEAEDIHAVESPNDEDDDHPRISRPGISTRTDGTRRISKKYPTLTLEPATSDVVRPDLFHLDDSANRGKSSFYSDSTISLPILQNKRLALNAGESGMHELQIALPANQKYTSGDHLLVYPQNSHAIVQAYLELLEVDPHATIVDGADPQKYPYPTGLTVMETLMHCVDLGAPPSPSFARMLLGLGRTDELDYKQDIAIPRRTIMDVVLEQARTTGTTEGLSLEDLLYQATPMKPRYYSIASSNVQYPHEVHLTYRPIKYVTTHGYLREGVCTSFLLHKGVLPQDNNNTDNHMEAASIPASIAPHPSFRLPSNPETPVMMIGGGCGVAPIRAFLQERVYLASNGSSFGKGILLMGYRNPQDEVYRELVQEALETGALSEAQIVYSSGCTQPNQKCMLVSELIRQEGAKVWEHMEGGGHVYICGGAYAFGATVKAELLDLVQERGKMTFEESEAYLRNLMDQGRFSADLAD